VQKSGFNFLFSEMKQDTKKAEYEKVVFLGAKSKKYQDY
jgi:hypothetical protein